MIQLSYDQRADALYIRLRRAHVDESDEVSRGVIVDYDRKGKPIGVEVLDASRLLGGRPHLKAELVSTASAKR